VPLNELWQWRRLCERLSRTTRAPWRSPAPRPDRRDKASQETSWRMRSPCRPPSRTIRARDAAPRAGGNTTRPMRDALDAELARARDDGEGHNVLQQIARRLAAKALEGDLGAIREIFDRIDGKLVAVSAPEQTPRQVEMQ